MLPDLHAALAGYPGELPLLAPVHEDVPYGLAALERRPDVLSPPERNRLLTLLANFGRVMTWGYVVE